jgi:hypothetical protein
MFDQVEWSNPSAARRLNGHHPPSQHEIQRSGPCLVVGERRDEGKEEMLLYHQRAISLQLELGSNAQVSSGFRAKPYEEIMHL